MSRGRSSPRRGRAIFWPERAVADLEAVAAHIATDNPAAAEHWVEALMSAVEAAATFPFAGRRVPEFASDTIREVLKGAYRIVYRVTA